MKSRYEVVLGSSQRFGDSRWHVGLFREGNCLSWASFLTRNEAEKWMESPRLPASTEAAPSFNPN